MIDGNAVGESVLTEEEQIYRENILDHYKHPHNAGALKQYTLKHRELNPLCGDEIELFVKVDKEKVEDVAFVGHGCAISQASASMLTDVIKGKKLADLKKMNKQDILDMLGIPIGLVRMKCALLSLTTLHKALEER